MSGSAADVRGFTLVEVLVAVLLLVVGLLGLSATLSVVAWRMSVAELETRVRTGAEAEIEALLAAGYDRLAPGISQRAGLAVDWQVDGDDPRRVTLVARGTLGRHERADTLETLVRRR